MLNAAILIYEGVELLDFAGPGQVFQVTKKADKPAFNVYTVAPTLNTIKSQEFVKVIPQYNLNTAPMPDLLVVPGGTTSNIIKNRAAMRWIRQVADSAQIVMSVCTGAFILAEAGLLDHKKATTWHNAIHRLREKVPSTEVIEHTRFVDSGKIITTAGITAGIDGALYVVSRLIDKKIATETESYIEY